MEEVYLPLSYLLIIIFNILYQNTTCECVRNIDYYIPIETIYKTQQCNISVSGCTMMDIFSNQTDMRVSEYSTV